ncbi:putative ABC-type Fe3+ transport system protein [Rhodovulum sp. PH10]|uniref:DUF3341 domain-containing protein n=1 Tax=Rhodovulum sp. PH10 TaxID=1187851 RepID=UPI00027C2B02|nr:DUF3341 domain-containing protein [Rhodovulum sp. PH10]EJW12531.1 putative ABC-type Fe3+ transport system protein [Rhodovulum sp. PH10]
MIGQGKMLAEFTTPEALRRAVPTVRRAGHRVVDAFTPYPVEGLAEEIGPSRAPLRLVMLMVGLAVAIAAYLLQWYSAVIAYPMNTGGRPLHSWPVFLLVPFEIGMFTAALAGLVALFWSCGLPRLHDPLFAVPGFERATQDRFFLLAEAAASDQDGTALRHVLEDAGARVVTEVRRQ